MEFLAEFLKKGGIFNPRPAMRSREERNTRDALKLHKELMDQYVAQGMPKEEASRKAFDDVKNKKAQGYGGPGGGYFSNSPINRGKPCESNNQSVDKYLLDLQGTPETAGVTLTPVGAQGTQGHKAPWQVYHDYPLSRKPWKVYDPAKDPSLMNNPNRRHVGPAPLPSEKMNMVGKKIAAGEWYECPDCNHKQNHNTSCEKCGNACGIKKIALTGLWNDIRNPNSESPQSMLLQRPDNSTQCPTCHGGLTRRYNKDNRIENVCTRCEYDPRSTPELQRSAASPSKEDLKQLPDDPRPGGTGDYDFYKADPGSPAGVEEEKLMQQWGIRGGLTASFLRTGAKTHRTCALCGHQYSSHTKWGCAGNCECTPEKFVPSGGLTASFLHKAGKEPSYIRDMMNVTHGKSDVKKMYALAVKHGFKPDENENLKSWKTYDQGAIFKFINSAGDILHIGIGSWSLVWAKDREGRSLDWDFEKDEELSDKTWSEDPDDLKDLLTGKGSKQTKVDDKGLPLGWSEAWDEAARQLPNGDTTEIVSLARKIFKKKTGAIYVHAEPKYGLRWQEFDKNDRVTTKEKWFTSVELREGFANKAESKDNFKEFSEWSDPREEAPNVESLALKHQNHDGMCNLNDPVCKAYIDMRVADPGWWPGRTSSSKPKCPHCGSTEYGLMPTDFETAKCSKCGKNWEIGIVKGVNGSKHRKRAGQWGARSWDSDQVHDILDDHRPNGDMKSQGFDEPVPEDQVPACIEAALNADGPIFVGVIVFLVEHRAEVPQDIREAAIGKAQNELDPRQLQEWQNPEERKIALEREIRLLSSVSSQSPQLNPTKHQDPKYRFEERVTRLMKTKGMTREEAEETVKSVIQEKEAASTKLECCGSITGFHKQNCPVYSANVDKTLKQLEAIPKRAGHPLRFGVPTIDAGAVAAMLHQKGLSNFMVEEGDPPGASYFEFKTPQERTAAHELVKANFKSQIQAGKGLWAIWAMPEGEGITNPQTLYSSLQGEYCGVKISN
jgi:hypothetical protein